MTARRANAPWGPRAGWISRRRGFTLVELLVVVAILVLLISILTPSMRKARDLARSAACRSHLHEIGQGHHTYSAIHAGYTIPTVNQRRQWWTTSLVPHIGSREVLFCPEATTGVAPRLGTLVIGGRHTAWFDGWQYPSDPLDCGSYGQNMWLNHYDNAVQNWNQPKSLHFGGTTASVPDPAAVPLVAACHWVGGYPRDTDAPWDFEWDGVMFSGHMLNRFTMNRHDGKAGVVFVDGHARLVPIPEMWRLVWNKLYTPQFLTVPWME